MNSAEPASPCALLVEDDLSLRQSLCIAFENEQIDVDVAEDGAEALRLLAIRSYRLVVIDLLLPKVSGTEVLDYLESNPEVHTGNLVVLSEDEASAASLRESGRVARTFVKPIDPPAIARDIRELCVSPEDSDSVTGDTGAVDWT